MISTRERFRSLIPPAAVRLVDRLHRALDGTMCKSYSQEGEDLLLSRLLGERGPGFYVDIGAHHPRRFSNTQLFYERGWRGLNIEPAPDAIELFRVARTRDVNLALGVSDTPGELTYYVFDDTALNTFDENLKRQRENGTPYRVVASCRIPVERLDRILAQFLPARQSIDFLSVDAEGLDLAVLRSNDWQVYRPEIVLVEALDFALERAGSHPLHTFMTGVGYELVAKTLNTLFYRDRG